MAFMGLEILLGQCVLTEFDSDGHLLAQPRALGDDPRVESHEVHHVYGFQSRPLDPDVDADGKPIQGRACTLLYGSIGNSNHCWFGSDPRPVEHLPVIGKGESMMFGPKANFVRCKADGSVTLFTTTDGTVNGKSVYAQVRPDGFTFLGPWGKLAFDATGFHMLHASGARIDAGAISGLPAPLDTLGSYLKVQAAILQLEGAAISIGTTDGVPDQVAKSAALIAALQAIDASLIAIGSALSALGNGSAAAAITASTTAIGTAVTAIPSQSANIT